MVIYTWPADLPQSFETGLSHADIPKKHIASKMSSGATKTRRRYTASAYQIKVSVTMTEHQLLIFNDWYENTIKEVLPFQWTHPHKGVLVDYRILKQSSRHVAPGETGNPGDLTLNGTRNPGSQQSRWKLSLVLEYLNISAAT